MPDRRLHLMREYGERPKRSDTSPEHLTTQDRGQLPHENLGISSAPSHSDHAEADIGSPFVTSAGTPSAAASAPTLDDALLKARREGWCLLSRPISRVVDYDLELSGPNGPQAIPHRTGGKIIAELEPTPPEAAPKRSLSATYGQGAFPLHTDGAYMNEPPEFVLLESVGSFPSTVPTTLIRLSTIRSAVSQADLELGMFRVQEHGGSASYRPALESGRIRFDTGCMSAADPRSRRVATAIRGLSVDYEHYWDTPGTTLVIHNHMVLHARGDATDDQGRKLHRLLLNGRHR